MKKESLRAASLALMALHKSLLEYQKERLELMGGKTLNPYEALNAVLHDPQFSWLKQISQMIVKLDIEHDDLDNEERKSEVLPIQELKDFFNQPSKHFQDQLIKAIEKNPDISFLFSRAKQAVLAL